MRWIYSFGLLPLALGLAWCAALVRPRLRANLRARRGLAARLSQAATRRDPRRPLLWCHAASAGEFLQAEPLLAHFRERGCQVAVTLTSVSGLPWLRRIESWPELVWAGMAPFDVRAAVRGLLDALRPTALVIVQADLWPNLVLETRARGIPQVLIAARIGAGAIYRQRWPLRGLYRQLYGGLDAIAALTPGDRERLLALAPGHARLIVGGDPGIATVLARLGQAEGSPAVRELASRWPATGGPRLIAGSIWPQDEAHLLPVLREALHELPGLAALLVPHEPAEAHLRALEDALGTYGVRRLSLLEAPGATPAGAAAPRVVLVDGIGRLAGLYPLASVAYVGGAFSTGVHNVAEPAAAGLPVVFGPRHGKSPVAQALLDAGGGFAVHDTAALRAALLPLLRDAGLARQRGAAAAGVIGGMVGAVERCERLILDAVPALRITAGGSGN